MNLKGSLGDQLMIFNFIFLLLIISIAIIAGVSLFYGFDYDSRSWEAEAFSQSVKKCVEQVGMEYLDQSSFLVECGFVQDISDKGLDIKICIDDGNCIEEKDPLIVYGSNFEICGFSEKENENFPKCFQDSFSYEGFDYVLVVKNNKGSYRK